MTKQETLRVLAAVMAVYPSVSKDRDTRILTEVWHRVFAGMPYEQVIQALEAYIAGDAKGFPPTPGAVNALIRKKEELEGLTENEAWDLVYRAACRGYYNSAEEFAALPEEVRRVVGSPRMLFEWAQMDSGELNTVIASSFRRSWRARRELRRELGAFAALPEGRDGVPRLPENR